MCGVFLFGPQGCDSDGMCDSGAHGVMSVCAYECMYEYTSMWKCAIRKTHRVGAGKVSHMF